MTSTNTKIIKRTGLTEPVNYKSADDVFNAVVNDLGNENIRTQLIAGDRQSGVSTTLMRVLGEIVYRSGASDKPLTIGVVMSNVTLHRDRWVEYLNGDNHISLKRKSGTSTYVDGYSGSTIYFSSGTLHAIQAQRYDVIVIDQVDYVQNKIVEYACTGLFATNVIMGATPSTGYITDKENDDQYFNVSRSYLFEPKHNANAIRYMLAWGYDEMGKEYPNLIRKIFSDYAEQHKDENQ